MTDTEFLDAFETCTLPADCWTHEAHLRMAWLVAQREANVGDAIARARRGIQAYNASRGNDPGKYHETVTLAYMRLVWHAVQSTGAGDSFDAFKEAHRDLFGAYPGPLLRYYTRAILDDRMSYDGFIDPDLAPLP